MTGKNANPPTCPELIVNIVKGLLRQQSALRVFQHNTTLQSIPTVTANDVLNAVNRVDIKKTLGLDRIPNGILKLIII